MAKDPDVVGFKSVVCYRTGLAVALNSEWEGLQTAVHSTAERYKAAGTNGLRLQDKPLNDLVVRITMEIAGASKKPGVMCLKCGYSQELTSSHSAVPYWPR